MKRWEMENYLFDKEVLAAYCQNKGRSLDDNKYNEKNFRYFITKM